MAAVTLSLENCSCSQATYKSADSSTALTTIYTEKEKGITKEREDKLSSKESGKKKEEEKSTIKDYITMPTYLAN